MKNQFLLSIPRPCSENWTGFSSTAQGGMCRTCNKEVLDLYQKSEQQLAKLIQQRPTGLCGRVQPRQLKIYPVAPRSLPQPGFGLMAASIVLVLTTLSQPIEAGTAELKGVDLIHTESIGSTSQNNSIVELTIRGIVKAAEEKEPLAGVNVYLKGSSIGTTTDAAGKFEFPKKLKEGDVLVFSFIGLKTQEYVVSAQSPAFLEIDLAYDDVGMMGELVIDQVYESPEPSAISRWWGKLKNLF